MRFENIEIIGGEFDANGNGRYDKTGGTVSSNATTHTNRNWQEGSNDDIARMKGALGSGWQVNFLSFRYLL